MGNLSLEYGNTRKVLSVLLSIIMVFGSISFALANVLPSVDAFNSVSFFDMGTTSGFGNNFEVDSNSGFVYVSMDAASFQGIKVLDPNTMAIPTTSPGAGSTFQLNCNSSAVCTINALGAGFQGPVAVHNGVLYLGTTSSTQPDRSIMAFLLNPDGSIRFPNFASITNLNSQAGDFAVDHTNERLWVYTVNGQFDVYDISAGNELTPISSDSAAGGTADIAVNPNTGNGFVQVGATTTIQEKARDGSFVRNFNIGFPILKFDFDSRTERLFALVDNSGPKIRVFDNTGAFLTQFSVTALQHTTSLPDIRIDEDKQVLYVSNDGGGSDTEGSGGVNAYDIDPGSANFGQRVDTANFGSRQGRISVNTNDGSVYVGNIQSLLSARLYQLIPNLNVAPDANDDSFTTQVDTSINNLNVLLNDTDADGDPLIVFGIGHPFLTDNPFPLNGGTATINATNNGINYTPPAGFRGVDIFNYTITDGNFHYDNATIRMAILGTNGKITFSSFRDGNQEIYIMNSDGTGQANISNNAALDLASVWSPDGTKIAFESNRDGNLEIYTMNPDGTGLVRLTNDAAGDGVPGWSPDGTKIVFQTNRDGVWNEIYVMNSDGTGQTRLTVNQVSDDQRPSWSPDGTKIVFDTGRDGNDEIYTMNLDGTGLVRLTNNGAADFDASWSPDGTKIAFVSQRDANNEIYTMNADGTGQTNISNNLNDDLAPRWSPDGNKIVFESHRDGNPEIYVMNADGTGVARLTTESLADTLPDWGTLPNTLNNSPVANNDSYSTQVGIQLNNLNVLLNDTDADADALTISAISPTLNAGIATINATNNGINFTAPVGFSGVDRFFYTISDGNGGFDSANVTIIVQPINNFLFEFGSPANTASSFNGPTDVKFSPNGDIVIVERDANQTRVLDKNQNQKLVIGTGVSGTADGQFNRPSSAAINATGFIFVADTFNDRIQVFDPDGTHLKTFGTPGNGNNQFQRPNGIAFNSAGELIVADQNNNRIMVYSFDSNGDFVFERRIGSPGPGLQGAGSVDGELDHPTALGVDSNDNVWVADTFNARLQKFASDGTHLLTVGVFGTGDGQFTSPSGIGIDSYDNVYASDTAGAVGSDRVQIFASDGTFLDQFGSTGASPGQFDGPTGSSFDSKGNFYVADRFRDKILVFGQTPNTLPVANFDVFTTQINTPLLNLPVLANDTDADGDPLTITSVKTINGGTATINATNNGINFTPQTGFRGVYLLEYNVTDGHSPGVLGSVSIPVLGTNGKIAFSSIRNGDREIFSMNSDGTDVQQLTSNSVFDSNPVYSPNGTKIVYVTNDGDFEIAVMNSDGTNQIQLTNNAFSDLNPKWSPDGSSIVFDSNRDGNNEIYILNATGQVNLSNSPGTDDREPSFNTDGLSINFQRNGQIHKMLADGSNQFQLITNPGINIQPQDDFGPTSTIVFANFSSGNVESMEIISAKLLESDNVITRLTNNNFIDNFPSFSPDNSKIIFASNSTGIKHIFTMNRDGTGLQDLSLDGLEADSPSWGIFPDSSAGGGGVPPVANAGPDRTVNEQTIVTLDGTGSFDLDGNPLSYSWVQQAPIPQNPVAEYLFENDLVDTAGGDNSGTAVSGTATYAPGPTGLGQALSLNGLYHVSLANEATFDFDRTSPFSASLWVKTTAGASSFQYLLGKSTDRSTQGWNIELFAGRPYVSLSNTASTNELRLTASQGNEVNDGNWHHVAVTYDGIGGSAGFKIYVDGTSRSFTAFPNNLASTALNDLTASIGGSNSGSLKYAGSIDNVRVYDRNLSQADVTLLKNEGVATLVSLSNANTATPSFTSPVVPNGQQSIMTFDLTVTDLDGQSSDSVTVTVEPVNVAPVALSDTYVTDEDTTLTVTPFGVLSNDSDPDGDALTTQLVSTTTKGTLTLNSNGGFTYTPSLNFAGTDSFTYKAHDATLGSNTATVTITVNPVPDVPIANAGPDQTVNENALVRLTGASSIHPDGDSLTYSWTQTSGAPVSLSGENTATPTFVAPDLASGSVALVFSLTVTDSLSNTSTDSVLVTVNAIPVLTASAGDAITSVENSIVTLDGTASADPNADSLTYSWIQLGALPPNPVAEYLFENDLVDTAGGDNSGTAVSGTATYAPGPTGLGQSLDLSSGTYYAKLANEATFDFDRLSPFSASLWVKTPQSGFAFKYLIGKSSSLSTTGWNIELYNGKPFVSLSSTSGQNEMRFTGQPGSEMNDGNWHHLVITYDGSGFASGLRMYVDGTNRGFFVTPNNLVSSILNNLDVSIGGANTGSFKLNGSLDNIRVYSRALSASEVQSLLSEGSSNTVAITLSGANTANPTFTTTEIQNGQTQTLEFQLTVTNSLGETSTAVVPVTISSVNRIPVATNDAFTIDEDSGANNFAVLSNDSDPDDDPIIITSVNAASSSGVAIINATKNGIDFTPNANFRGITSFTYTISDGFGGTSTATVSVTVNDVNDPPIAVNDNAVAGASTVTINVLANDADPDGDSLVVSSVGTSTAGVTPQNDGNSVSYTPLLGPAYSDSFTYTISDGRGGTKTASVSVLVNEVNLSFDDGEYGVGQSAKITLKDPSVIVPLVHVSSLNGDPVGFDVPLSQEIGYPGIFSTPVNVRLLAQTASSDPATSTLKVTLADDGTGILSDTVTARYVISGNNIETSVKVFQDPIGAVGDQVDKNRNLSCGGLDADNDLACDSWETDDFLFIEGTNTLFFYPCDSPNGCLNAATTPDVYIEIDWVEGHKPPQEVLDRVRAAFEANGVRLHFLLDESIGSFEQSTSWSEDTGASRYDEIKREFFGTKTERADPFAPELLELKRQVFRYVLFAHTLEGAPRTSGIAESPGNDAMITLGSFTDNTGSIDQQSATLLHEIGHMLGLKHGGDDNINCKPNYPSVMSYSRQFANIDTNRPLDFSHGQLVANVLDENNLNEQAGLGSAATSDISVIYGTPNGIKIGNADGNPINWNNNLNPDGTPNIETSTTSDVNNIGIGGCGPTPLDSNIHDFNDWVNLNYNFRGVSTFLDGSHNSVSEQEFTADAVIQNLLAIDNDIQQLPDTTFDDAGTEKPAINFEISGFGQAVDKLLIYGSTGAKDDLETAIVETEGVQVAVNSFIIDDNIRQDFSLRVGKMLESMRNDLAPIQSEFAGPVASDDIYAISEDSMPITLSVLNNDIDLLSKPFTIDSITASSKGVAIINPGGLSISYSAISDKFGQDQFSYTIKNIDGLVSTGRITVNIAPLDDAPIANDDFVILDDAQPMPIDVLANDIEVDGDTLDIVSVGVASKGTIHNTGSTIIYTRTPGQIGTDSFSYTISDTTGNTATASVFITSDSDSNGISDEIDTGLGGFSDVSVGGTTSGQIIGNGGKTIIISDTIEGVRIETTRSLSTTPAIISACDQQITVSINSESQLDLLCTASGNQLASTKGLSVVDFRDGFGNIIGTVTNLQQGNAISFTEGINSIPSTLLADSDNLDILQVTSRGTTTPLAPGQIFSFNAPPLAVDDEYVTQQNNVLNIDIPGVLSNDVDNNGDSLIAIIETNAANGVLELNEDGSFVYSPNSGFTGVDTYTYRASDGLLTSPIAIVTITVTPSNLPPVAMGDSVSVDEDSHVIIDVLANDSDPDGDLLAITSATVDKGIVIVTENTLEYTPLANDFGDAKILYEISDGNGGVASANVEVTINPIPDVPVALDQQINVLQNSQDNVIPLTASDADNDIATFLLTTIPQFGTVIQEVQPDLITVKYTPGPGFTGQDVFIYSVQDATGLESNSAQVTINVVPQIPPIEDNLRQDKLTIVDELQDIRDSTQNQRTIKLIEKSISNILKSTGEELWKSNHDSLDEKHGKKVFNTESQAIRKIMSATMISESDDDAWDNDNDDDEFENDSDTQTGFELSAIIRNQLHNIINRLVDVDRTLAQNAIDDANGLILSSSPTNKQQKKIDKYLEKINESMEKAQQKIEKGKFHQGALKYKDAWKNAQEIISILG